MFCFSVSFCSTVRLLRTYIEYCKYIQYHTRRGSGESQNAGGLYLAASHDVLETCEVSEKLDNSQNIFFNTDEDHVSFFRPHFDALTDLNVLREI